MRAAGGYVLAAGSVIDERAYPDNPECRALVKGGRAYEAMDDTEPTASVYAGAGRLNVVAVGLIGFVATVVGDNIGFAIGHYGGCALVLRWGPHRHDLPLHHPVLLLRADRAGRAVGGLHCPARAAP